MSALSPSTQGFLQPATQHQRPPASQGHDDEGHDQLVPNARALRMQTWRGACMHHRRCGTWGCGLPTCTLISPPTHPSYLLPVPSARASQAPYQVMYVPVVAGGTVLDQRLEAYRGQGQPSVGTLTSCPHSLAQIMPHIAPAPLTPPPGSHCGLLGGQLHGNVGGHVLHLAQVPEWEIRRTGRTHVLFGNAAVVL